MDLYLVRHAIAHDPDPVAWPDDSRRPLTDRGVERFRRAAAGLHTLAPPVDRVLASPYVRTVQTAELLARDAGWPAHEPCDALAPGGTVNHVVEAIAAVGGVQSIALVGHQPDLGELLSWFLTDSGQGVASEFRKGGVAALGFPRDEVTPGSAVLRWFATPKMLRGLAPRG